MYRVEDPRIRIEPGRMMLPTFTANVVSDSLTQRTGSADLAGTAEGLSTRDDPVQTVRRAFVLFPTIHEGGQFFLTDLTNDARPYLVITDRVRPEVWRKAQDETAEGSVLLDISQPCALYA